MKSYFDRGKQACRIVYFFFVFYAIVMWSLQVLYHCNGRNAVLGEACRNKSFVCSDRTVKLHKMAIVYTFVIYLTAG